MPINFLRLLRDDRCDWLISCDCRGLKGERSATVLLSRRSCWRGNMSPCLPFSTLTQKISLKWDRAAVQKDGTLAVNNLELRSKKQKNKNQGRTEVKVEETTKSWESKTFSLLEWIIIIVRCCWHDFSYLDLIWCNSVFSYAFEGVILNFLKCSDEAWQIKRNLLKLFSNSFNLLLTLNFLLSVFPCVNIWSINVRKPDSQTAGSLESFKDRCRVQPFVCFKTNGSHVAGSLATQPLLRGPVPVEKLLLMHILYTGQNIIALII